VGNGRNQNSPHSNTTQSRNKSALQSETHKLSARNSSIVPWIRRGLLFRIKSEWMSEGMDLGGVERMGGVGNMRSEEIG
jgi:hypothetical protein